MAEVTVLTGTHLSDRAAQIDALLDAHWGRAILVLPSHRLAEARADTFLAKTGRPGFLGNPFKTFDRLASEILEGAGIYPETLSDFERNLLVLETVDELRAGGELGEYAPAGATSGFAAHALRVVTQLKQAGIEPEAFHAAIQTRAHPSGFDAIIHKLYDRYQNEVKATGVFDRVGVIWRAELEVRENAAPMTLAEIDWLLLDAFDDFTPSELRFVDALALHVPHVAFGIPFSPEDPSQGDLYALPAATYGNVRGRFAIDQPKPCKESDPLTFPQWAAQQLFWRSEPRNPPHAPEGLALIEYRDELTEIEATGRSVKTLLLEGAAPDSIAVVHRNLSDVAPIVRSVFGEFGIPVSMSVDARLRDSSIAAFLLELLEACDAWERDRIAGVLTSPWFCAAWDAEADTGLTFLLARAAGIIQGRRDWFNGLEALHERLRRSDRAPENLAHHTDPGAACTALRAAFDRLGELVDRFPDRAPEVEYTAGLLHALDALQMNRGLEEESPEAKALERLRQLLLRWQSWCEKRRDGAAIARTEFVNRFRRALGETPAGAPRQRGGVQCMTMDDARHLTFEHVFIIGMNEGTVPSPAPVNAIYGPLDVEAFAEKGVQLDSHKRHMHREMLLLHRCMAASAGRVTVSWHAVDERGKARAASPFVDDIRSVVDADLSARGDGPFPDVSRVASPRDLAAAVPVTTGLLHEPLETRIETGARIERRRLDASPFGLYDGVLQDAELTAALTKRFGDAHTFSVNQLERYAECPFSFFTERVLSIAEDVPPEIEIDRRERGTVLHNILFAFYQRFRGIPLPEIPEADALAAMRECVDAAFEPLLSRGAPHARVLWAVERTQIQKLLALHVRTAIVKESPRWSPQYFELQFGPLAEDAEPSPTKLPPYVMETEAGPVRFSGKIDRIDDSENGVRIVDYKTTLKTSVKDAENGESLQLPIYAMAWDARHADRPCVEAAFVEIGYQKTAAAISEKNGEWSELAATVTRRTGELVTGIRTGAFPPDAGKGGCHGCRERRACRYEESRIERKHGES